MTLVFSPGSRSNSLSLPRNQNRRERYVLGIIQGQDHDSLEVVQGQDLDLIAHLTDPSFLDPTLSLIISNFHFCITIITPSTTLIILVASTQHAL